MPKAGGVPAAVGPRIRGALPDAGERVPAIALPTVGLFAGALAAWCLATAAVIAEAVSPWLTVPVHAVAGFVMFTVLHDGVHYSISRVRWVNGLFGRLAAPFVAIYMSFPLFKFIHIQHHRFANEDSNVDPDHYTEEGSWWQLPFRWATIDFWYGRYYFAHRKQLVAADARESFGVALLAVAGIALSVPAGVFWEVALIVLIPQRIQLVFLAWWFDWLPHHGLGTTQRENRYGATRIRVGLEWLMTPLMLSQNYHLVHHLHPSIPFYRYLPAWRHNEEGYLQHDPALATVFGQSITADEYRSLREMDSRLAQMLPVRIPEGTESPHGVFHRLRVSEVSRPTEDSVSIVFDVPEDLEPYFRFEPGQHLTVRSDHGGEGVRRNYSICSRATGGELRIGVKRIPDGAFSTYAAEELSEGDELEVMTPTGSFGPRLDPGSAKHYAAIAAGSGITPVLSILETVLDVEADSSFTLVYVNRTPETTMFRDRLDELVSRYADRLEVLHVLTREEQRDPVLNGRLDADRLARLRDERFPGDEVDEWFLCGPPDMVDALHASLIDSGIDNDHVQVELFAAPSDGARGGRGVDSEVTIRLDGDEESFELDAGCTVLEGALKVRDDTPYSCQEGVCGTCRAKLVEGDGEMSRNYALKQAEVDEGYVLTCQLQPTTESLTVDYDG